MNVKEYEMKFLVSRNDFKKSLRMLQTQFPQASINHKEQVNYYYDTDNFDLSDQNITLRVRQIENSFMLQEKQHNKDNVHISEETEKQLSSLPFSVVWRNKVAELQGRMKTLRTSIWVDERIKVDFDENHYLGVCDYEVEIEFQPEIRLQAEKLAVALGLRHPNTVRKSARFFRAREKGKQHAEI